MRADAEALVESMFLAGARDPGPNLIARTWAAILRDSATRRARELAAGVRAAVAEIWATLSADSLQPSAAVRGADDAMPRLLVYETADYSVSLSFVPAAEQGSTDIIGQVVPKSALELPQGGQVQVRNRPELDAYRVSEFGEFRISGLARAEGTSLTVAFPEMRIHLGPLPPLGDE
jgi:hypothetical protein